MFRYEIDSGIAYNEIIDYFKDFANRVAEGEFLGKDWRLVVNRREDRKHHAITLPRTQLVFSGEENVVLKVIEAYRKNFMRGGG